MPTDQVWTLDHEGQEHRVVAGRNASHLVRWYVDGELRAQRKTMADKVTLAAPDGPARLLVYYSALGAPRRATLYPDGDDVTALVRLGGLDLVPEPGSSAERYDERLREHPNRYAGLAAVGGAAKVLVPILLTVVAVHLAVNVPWPHVPWPHIPRPDLPSVPWPDVPTPDLPEVPDRVWWVVDKAKYVWPVVVAYVIARAEIKRRRDRAREPEPAAEHEADLS